MLDEEQKEMLRNEIKKVRLQPNEVPESTGDDIPIERLLENYIEMSSAVIKEMENHRDPVFLEVLRYAQLHLTRADFQSALDNLKVPPFPTPRQKNLARHYFAEFLSLQIEIYAACNKIAMKQCSLDRFAHLVVLHEPVP